MVKVALPPCVTVWGVFGLILPPDPAVGVMVYVFSLKLAAMVWVPVTLLNA